MNIIEKISSLKWGLSKQEYKSIFSDKQWLPDHPSQNALGFYGIYDNKQISIVAHFLTDMQDKLGKITITFEDIQTDTQCNFIFEDMIQVLNKIYSEPAEYCSELKDNDPQAQKRNKMFNALTISKHATWLTDDTIIEILMFLTEHGSPNPFFGITFYDRQNDPFAKRFAKYFDKKYTDNKNANIKNVTKDYEGQGFQILSANIKNDEKTNNLNKKLEALSSLVNIYTYIFAYAFLRMIEISKDKSFEIDNIKIVGDDLEKIYGRYFSEWPDDIKNHYLNKLWFVVPQEKLFHFFRETIYYLIFIFFSYSHKYLKPSEHKLMLDKLFEIFESSQVPWLINPPDQNAFNKYNDAENPILKYNSEISNIFDDILVLFHYQNEVIGTFKFIIFPTIDKIFENKK